MDRNNMRSDIPNAQRLPKYTFGVGWLLVGLGVIFCITAPLPGGGFVPLLTMGVITLALGCLALLAYRNWYLVVGPTSIRQQTLTRKVKTINYDDIASHRGPGILGNNVIKAQDGTKIVFGALTVNARLLYEFLRKFDLERHNRT